MASAASLEPNTTYHFRLAAANVNGTSFGQDVAFKTPKATPKSLSLKVSRKHSRFTFSGKLTLPSGVSAATACRGTVKLKVKHGSKTVSSPKASLGKKCTYSVAKTLNLSGSGRLSVAATFAGNGILTTKASKSTSAKD